MRLYDIDSAALLPAFVHASWESTALDAYVTGVEARRASLAAPWSMGAVSALTDAEESAWYEDLGVASYYPDVSRTVRDRSLYRQTRYMMRLGTPAAVEYMMRYTFDDDGLRVDIEDCLAVDPDTAHVIRPELLDLYDARIYPSTPTLTAFEVSRIFAGLTRYGRDTQKLRHVSVVFVTSVEQPLRRVATGAVHRVIDAGLCIPVEPPAPVGGDIGLMDDDASGIDFPVGLMED